MQEVKCSTPEKIYEFNQSQPEIEPLTEQEECDMIELLIVAGLLIEVNVH